MRNKKQYLGGGGGVGKERKKNKMGRYRRQAFCSISGLKQLFWALISTRAGSRKEELWEMHLEGAFNPFSLSTVDHGCGIGIRITEKSRFWM